MIGSMDVLASTRINRLGLVALAIMWNLSATFSARSQTEAVTPPMPPSIIGPLRQLEDYSYLEDPAARSGYWWEPLKYIPLWPVDSAPFVSLGGEVRARYEWIDNTDFGSGPQDTGGYLLTRYIPFVSLTAPDMPGGSKLRVFGQFLGAFSHGDARGPGPLDEDNFDILQAFGELTIPLGDGNLTLQGGRQSISFGTERLLGTRYGPNIPLSFDGGLVHWNDERWAAHAFYLRPVRIDPDPLNNVSSADQQIWGLYATRQLGDLLPGLPNTALDLYYIGFFDAAAIYNSGTGRELRHTVGSRAFGEQPVPFGTLDWNYEGILQFGSFDSERGRGDILAWSAGTETGYTLDAPFTPRFSFRANIISGDNDPEDADLQTFNPLYPKGKYFGELTPVGPYNLINLQGGLSLRVTDQTTLYLQGGPYWRYSTGDAVYGVGGNIVRGDAGRGGASYIGSQWEVVAEWSPVRELAFLVSYSQFTPGAFIRESGPAETIHFVAVEATIQF
jgi:hypothetical protein